MGTAALARASSRPDPRADARTFGGSSWREEAVGHLRGALAGAKEQAVPRLADWLTAVSPSWRWDWPHLRLLQHELERVTRGENHFLIVEIPVRHGKTELVTVRYPVHRLERDRELRVILGAYNDTRARKYSRKARRIARQRGIALSTERDTAEEWETVQGGGVRAVGVGAGVTGEGGNLIVIDDPVKSREEANSLAFRDRVWDWYTNDVRTRLEPGGAIIMVMSRWHEDDPVGRILASEDGPNWTVVRLPALAEANDPLGREEGEALCPDRFDEAALEAIRLAIGDYAFSALYQQQPTAKAGEMFDPAWFEIVEPGEVPRSARRIRWWDRAATEGGGDFTAGALVARAGPTYYVEDLRYFQHSAGKRDPIIRQTAMADRARYQDNPPVVWGEQEPGSGGKDAARAFVQLLAGFAAYTEPTTGDKETGAEPFAAQAQAGNVKIVRGLWNAHFREEARTFPRGQHDDSIEAAFRAFNKLSLEESVIDTNPAHYRRAQIHA